MKYLIDIISIGIPVCIFIFFIFIPGIITLKDFKKLLTVFKEITSTQKKLNTLQSTFSDQNNQMAPKTNLLIENNAESS